MEKDKVKSSIKKTSWHADWSGPFSLLEVSTSQRIYFNGLKNVFGKSFNSFFVIYKKGIASSYLPEIEYIRLGKYFGKKLKKDENAQIVADNFIRLADKANKVITLPPKDFLRKLEPSRLLYEKYGAHNVAIKMAVDTSGSGMSDEIREILGKSRRYSETFYKNNAKAFFGMIELIKAQTGYSRENIFMMTRRELMNYLKNGKMPSKRVLDMRFDCCGIYSNRKGQIILSSEEILDIEKYWTRGEKNILLGKGAFPGKVKGRCRIILDFKNVSFEKGDILVTGMTDPDYVPIMNKALAIITDGGGILSHAAIVARELKKPCIIGTKIATKVLKDGDLVEVDAGEGVVKILSRAKK